MSDPYLVLTPVVVLLLFLLFRFIGCDRLFGLQYVPPEQTNGEPDYPKTILTQTELVSYWRLQEPASTVAGDSATDEQGGNPGTYQAISLPADPPTLTAAAPGTLQPGAPGMLEFQPSTSMYVDGGYVEVPFNSTLNPPGFSIEALLYPGWAAQDKGFFRTVVDSRGDGTSGYGIYAGPEDLQNPTLSDIWQVWIGDGTGYNQVTQFTRGPSLSREVVYDTPTYLALTGSLNPNGTTALSLFVFHPGINLDAVRAWDATLTYNPNTGPMLPFRIGMGRNPPGLQPIQPFKGRIQEVAVYKQALTPARICAHVLAAFKNL